VFCDQKTSGGGWTVFQKRRDGSVDFFRPWDDYKRGFGNLNGEFWLGLDKIHRLTASNSNKLRVDLEDINGNTAFAEYSSFAVASERVKYQLSLGSYSGMLTPVDLNRMFEIKPVTEEYTAFFYNGKLDIRQIQCCLDS